MITMSAESERRFYRDADRAVVGGVCAGLASHFGLNLKVTRLLAVLAFLMAMPFMVIAYLAAVAFIPAVSRREYPGVADGWTCRKRRKRRRPQEDVEIAKPSAVDEINRRCKMLDDRLVQLEKHVTSKRFQIEQELSRL